MCVGDSLCWSCLGTVIFPNSSTERTTLSSSAGPTLSSHFEKAFILKLQITPKNDRSGTIHEWPSGSHVAFGPPLCLHTPAQLWLKNWHMIIDSFDVQSYFPFHHGQSEHDTWTNQ
ncbi:hypothetical protein CFOL_v3_12479 [Cephalotus follicularis]|uniref:Uncharacterized protein n=1 Tax=Cephalotus follicularis TaxID=3775 RepID=A0A1Q3BLS4_CEPFO|nr:hypothetical protein CFOL_v3_12479 [Cephalotus follicularis]